MGNSQTTAANDKHANQDMRGQDRHDRTPASYKHISESNVGGMFTGRFEGLGDGDSQISAKYVNRRPLINRAASIMTNDKGYIDPDRKNDEKMMKRSIFEEKTKKYVMLVRKALLLKKTAYKNESEYENEIHRSLTPKQILTERKTREVLSPRTLLNALQHTNLRPLLDDRYIRNVVYA